MTIPVLYLEDRGGRKLRGRRSPLPWERDEARGVVASAIALAVLAASATAGGYAASAYIGGRAQNEAARTGAASSERSTQLQLQAEKEAQEKQLAAERDARAADQRASEDALRFQGQLTEQNREDAEVNRHGDYDSWAARERRMSSIGGMLGLAPREIPEYRPLGPSIIGDYNGGRPPVSGPLPTNGSINWNAAPEQLSTQISAYFRSHGVADSETPYWVGKAQELVARGRELNDPGYADRRLSQADIFGRSGGGGAPAPVQNPTSTASGRSSAGSIRAIAPGSSFAVPVPTSSGALYASSRRQPVPGSIAALAA